MAEEAAVRKRTTPTKQAFLSLHAQVFENLSGDAQRLYEQIATSFEASLELLIADPAIALLIKSTAAEITERLNRIEESTSALVLATPAGGNQEEVLSTFQKVNRALATRYKDIRVETNRGQRPVAIDRIYIPSKLRAKKEPQALDEIIALDPTAKRMRDRLPNGHIDKNFFRVTYSEFRSGFRRAIVLGDPGGGKSTLCQYLCHHIAKQFNLSQQYVENSELDRRHDENKFDPQAMKVPLRVNLRSFEGARLSLPQLTIFDYLVNDLKSVVTTPGTQLPEFLRYVLTYGHAILAFDGLDEILNTGTRRDFVDLVTCFCNEFPLCPVFVTSRLVGYEDAPLPDDFEEFTLEKFDEREISQYLVKFLKVFTGEKQEAATARARAFVTQTQGTAGDLRQNPLMLGLMAFLFVTKGDVPTNRPEIYKECALLMFEKWDQNRNIKADIPQGFDMLHLFGEVASEIYGNPQLEEGVNDKWITDKNTKYFMNIYEDRAKAHEAAKKVTGFVTGRSWVMSEFGPDSYRFTHRTFMEYFFARHLDEREETVKELLDALLPHVRERQWDVISHLALQMKTFRNQSKTLQAVNELKAIVSASANGEAALVEVSSFFAHALTYLMPSEMECKAAVIDLTEAAFSIAQKDDAQAATALLRTLCGCVIERRDYVQQVIAEILERRFLRAADRPEFAFCAMLLSDEDLMTPFRNRAPLSLPPRLRGGIRGRLKDELGRRALADSFSACLYAEWYREPIEGLFLIHGMEMLTNDRRPWRDNVTVRTSPLLFAVILSMSRLSFTSAVPHEWAAEVLNVIGRNIDPLRLLADQSRTRITFPSMIWSRAITHARANIYVLRGLVFLYKWCDDSTSTPQPPKGDAPVSVNTSRAFNDQLKKLLGKLNPQEAELFDFWITSRNEAKQEEVAGVLG
jgi:hypothetical protein